MFSMLLSRSSICWAPARRQLSFVRSSRYLVRSSADGYAPQGPQYSSAAAPDNTTQEAYSPATIDSYAQYSDLSTSHPSSDDGGIEISADALDSAISYPTDASTQEMPPPPSVQYSPGAANVALVTGIVLDVKQDSESMGSYAVTLNLAVPAFGTIRPQHVQVLLKEQLASQGLRHLGHGAVVQVMGMLVDPSRQPKIRATAVSVVEWESLPTVLQKFFQLALEAKQEQPEKPPRAPRAQKDTYEVQQRYYNALLESGSFNAVAAQTGVTLQTVTYNTMLYIEKTPMQHIHWPELLHILGIAATADPVQPTVHELVAAVNEWRPLACKQPEVYLTKDASLKLKPLLDHIMADPDSPLRRKLHPLTYEKTDAVYRQLQLGRYVAAAQVPDELLCAPPGGFKAPAPAPQQYQATPQYQDAAPALGQYDYPAPNPSPSYQRNWDAGYSTEQPQQLATPLPQQQPPPPPAYAAPGAPQAAPQHQSWKPLRRAGPR